MPKHRKKQPAFQQAPATDRRPTYAVAPLAGKTPAAFPPNWMDEHPSWRIGRLELVDPYGWQDVGAAKLFEIRWKLANYETMTWGEILKDRDHNHPVAVNRLEGRAQKRLREIGLHMLDEIFRLRLSGRERVWGHRVGSVLHVLWWDPEHRVCPSPLRHT